MREIFSHAVKIRRQIESHLCDIAFIELAKRPCYYSRLN